MVNLKKHSFIALGYFFIVSVLGLFLRLFYVQYVELSFLNTNPKFLTHAHSHTALLGWVFLALCTLIYKTFLDAKGKEKLYKRIFTFGSVAVLGMLVTFPPWGYAPPSITFSTLYLIVSYFFSWFALNNVSSKVKDKASWKIVKSAIFYLILSSLGAWAIGPITVTVGPESFWHSDSLYFFLHFLYSGFVLLSLAGILFYYLESKGAIISDKYFKSFYIYINLGTILTYFLNVLWAEPPAIFYILGGCGALLQAVGIYYFLKIIRVNVQYFKESFDLFTLRSLFFAAVLLIVKIVLQVASAFPYVAELAFKYKDFIIGYLHMVFLGIVVPLLFIFLHYNNLIKLSKPAFKIFYVAFFLTETLIFYRGLASWIDLPFWGSYYNLLALFTIIFPVSIGIIFGQNITYGLNRKKLINDITSFFKLIY